MNGEATSSASDARAQGHPPATHLLSYTSEESKKRGSRTRILNAAMMYCRDQYLLTLRNLEEEYFPVCELHWYTDSEITAIMKHNLSGRFYEQFLNFAWGTNLASQFLK